MNHTVIHSQKRPDLLDHIEKEYGYISFRGVYDINLIVTRNPENNFNKFDDQLHLIFVHNNNLWCHCIYPCTADPGRYHLNNPGRVEGTAIVKSPQQLRGAYTFGRHKGRYECLVPRVPIPVWRDSNRDSVYDHDGDFFGYGINIHRSTSSGISHLVDRWSAGCIVLASSESYAHFLGILKNQPQYCHGKNFTFTIIDKENYETTSN